MQAKSHMLLHPLPPFLFGPSERATRQKERFQTARTVFLRLQHRRRHRQHQHQQRQLKQSWSFFTLCSFFLRRRRLLLQLLLPQVEVTAEVSHAGRPWRHWRMERQSPGHQSQQRCLCCC